MFRSRTPRSAVAAALSIALIAAFMVGTTSAATNHQASDRAAPAAPKPKPTPTPTPVPTPTPTPPNSDARKAYFGDPDIYPGGNGRLFPSIVTAGNTFAFDLFVKNEGTQRLTHSEVRYGSYADPFARTGSTTPSLPEGATIESATLGEDDCTITEDDLGALCDLGDFDAGETANLQFIVNAPDEAVTTATWAVFKVAETPPDQGANRNAFYADANLVVGPTNSNSNATYKTTGTFSLSTAGTNTLVKKDTMTTTVTGTVGGVGAISISEEDCAPNQCPGQIATVHVQDGAIQTPYLEWKLVIIGSFDGSITHELDNGQTVEFSASCSATLLTDCIFSNDKTGNVSTVVFRTATNGRVHG